MRKPIETLVGVLLAILMAVGTGSCSRSSSPTDIRPIASAWGTPFINAAAPQYLNFSKTVTDSNANTTLLWVTAGDNQPMHVWAQRYDAKRRAWGDAVQLDGNDLGSLYALDSLSLDAAVDSAGNVSVMWIADGYGHGDITKMRVSRYVAAREHWDTATAVRDLQRRINPIYDEHLIIGDSGNAAVVWWEQQTIGGGYQLWVTSLSSSGAWTTQRVTATESSFSEPYEIRFDAAGNAILTWIQDTNSNDVYNLWAAQRTSNGAWATPKILNTQNTGSVFEFKSAVDLLGNITWVWRQHTGVGDLTDGTNARLWSAQLPVGAKLGETTISVTPVDLDISRHYISRAWDLVGSGTGKFTLIWGEAEVGSNSKIWSRTLLAGSNWSAPIATETIADTRHLSDLRVVIDSAGRVTAVWRLTLSINSETDPFESFYANRMNSEGAWGTAANITNVINQPLQSGLILNQRLDQHGNLYVTFMLSGPSFGSGELFSIARIGAQHLFDGTPLVAVTLGDNVQYSPQITFGASGTAVVSWIKYNSTFNQLNGGVSARSVSADGIWSSIANLEDANGFGPLPPLVVQDKKGDATLVWHSVSITGVRMRTARFSNGEWTAGLDAVAPTNENIIRYRAKSLWLDGDDIPMLTVRTYEFQKDRTTLWSVGYPISATESIPSE